MDIGALHLIRPQWLLALPLAILLPLAWRHFRRPSGDWAKVCDPHLLTWLSVGQQGTRPARRGMWASIVLLSLTALALSGPSWQRLPDASFSTRDARVIVLDLSVSMLAEDLKPNRLVRVRFRLSDLLEQTREGQMGLVAYAGDAYVVAPLTSDMNTIANMLPALSPDIIPVAGSRADRALELAAELFSRAGAGTGEVLLITDSADASDVAVAADLAEAGIVTSVLGVGTREGAPIPSGNGFVSDSAGNVVIARMEAESLQALARAGGGRYSELGAGAAGSAPWLEHEGSEFARRDDVAGERWKDAGPWLILILLPAVAFGFRRGLLFLLPLLVLPGIMVSPPAHAGFWDDLWQRRDQQAQEALQERDAQTAAVLAEDPDIEGEAWYRAGDFQRAHQAWSENDSGRAHYNRGNALARAGEYDAAIAAYERALELDSSMEDALFNRALVEKAREQQQQQQQQQEDGEQGEPSQQQSENEAGEEGEQQEGQEGEQGEQQADQPQQGEQEMEAAWSEEDAQAMEQWLRRIPDDPGGLLRRKFRNQHLRRGAPPDEEKKW